MVPVHISECVLLSWVGLGEAFCSERSPPNPLYGIMHWTKAWSYLMLGRQQALPGLLVIPTRHALVHLHTGSVRTVARNLCTFMHEHRAILLLLHAIRGIWRCFTEDQVSTYIVDRMREMRSFVRNGSHSRQHVLRSPFRGNHMGERACCSTV